MRFHFVTAVVLISAVSMVCADEAPKPAGPKNPAAQAAIAKHEKTLADAAQVYQAAKAKADQELVAALKKVQGDVMKAGGPATLAESNAIQAIIDHPSAARSDDEILGEWKLQFTNGVKKTYIFRPGGKIDVTEGDKQWAGNWERRGGAYAVIENNGEAKRASLAGTRLFIEVAEGSRITSIGVGTK